VAEASASWRLALRLARRELRGGLAGFRIFLVCLMLGVAAIAAVGSVASAVRGGIAADARALLGGDVDVELNQRPASAAQIAFFAAAGELSATAGMRAMARPAAGGARVLVELKAVDGRYPLYGAVTLSPEMKLAAALARRDGAWGAVAEAALIDRLGLRLGERIRVGTIDYELRAILAREPDRSAGLFSLGPRLMVGYDSLEATGLVQPGSQIHHHYRVRLAPGAGAAGWIADLNAAFPDAGWRIRGPDDAAPGIKRFVDRAGLFLALVGLSTLLVGGVGVGNAVRTYLEGKTATIATLKRLGAPGGLVFRTYLALVMGLALGGTALGLVVGGLAPAAMAGLLGDRFGVALRVALYPGPLLSAAVFGLLTALAFSLVPLTRARDASAAALFRGALAPVRWRPRAADAAALALTAAALAGLAIGTATDRRLALWFVAAAATALVVLRVAAWAASAAARRLNGGTRGPRLRLGLANLYRPGAPTGSVVPSLGLGLTVLVAVGLVHGNLVRQIEETMPAAAPSFYFIDIQPQQTAAFDALVAAQPGAAELYRVPMLRGRIAALAGVPVERIAPPPELAWVLRGDRGVTWSATPPPGTRLVAGDWWPAEYRGPPLISLDAEVAAGFGLTLGDSVSVNVLGREVTGTIANLREVDWATLAINFVMVFSPGLLDDAPQTHIATVRVAPEAEADVQRAVTDRFANVSAIRVKEALEAVGRMIGAVSTAVGATAAVTLLAGVLVLAGAVAADHRQRVYDAVVLKVLGATRADIAGAFLIEYGLIGLVAAAVAAALGSAVGHYFVTRVLHGDWVFLPGVVAVAALLGAALALALGFAGTWRALGRRAAPLLRNE